MINILSLFPVLLYFFLRSLGQKPKLFHQLLGDLLLLNRHASEHTDHSTDTFLAALCTAFLAALCTAFLTAAESKPGA